MASGGGWRSLAHLQRDVVDINKLHGGPHAPVHLQRRPESAPHPGGKGGRVSALERRETQAVSELHCPRRHQGLGGPKPEHSGVLQLDLVPFVCGQHTHVAVQLQGAKRPIGKSSERGHLSTTVVAPYRADLTGDSHGSLALGIRTPYGSAVSSFQNNLQNNLQSKLVRSF